MKILACALMVLVIPAALAKPAPVVAAKRAPAMGQMMTVEVVYGDRSSRFKFEGPGKFVEYASSYGGERKAKLTVEDYAFFDRRIRGLTEPDNNTKLCPRRFVRIRSRYGVKIGCAGAPNNLAVKMDRIVNLAGKYF